MDFVAPQYQAPEGWPSLCGSVTLRAVPIAMPGGSPGVRAMKFFTSTAGMEPRTPTAPATLTARRHHHHAHQAPELVDLHTMPVTFGTFMDLSLHIQREMGLPNTWTDPMLHNPDFQAWWWEALVPACPPPPPPALSVVLSIL